MRRNPAPWRRIAAELFGSMHTIPELDRRGLRDFGLAFGAIIAVLFGLLLPWLFGYQFPWWPWIIAVLFGSWALAAPMTLNPVYRLWMKFGLAINAVVSRVVLAVVFYLVVLPTGMILRLRGRDPMQRKLDKQAKSYRTVSRPAPRDQMQKPF